MDKYRETELGLVPVGLFGGIILSLFMTTHACSFPNASLRAVKGDIASYGEVIESYARDHEGRYPNTLGELVNGDKKYVRNLQNDPWGNPYVYNPHGEGEEAADRLLSKGPDGILGSGDDVTRTSTVVQKEALI